MLYYVNWKLTNAQLELIAADVSVVDYNYDRKKKRKKNKGEFDNTKANQSSVANARDEWMKKYGQEEKSDAGGINIGDVFGGSLSGAKGFRSDGT